MLFSAMLVRWKHFRLLQKLLPSAKPLLHLFAKIDPTSKMVARNTRGVLIVVVFVDKHFLFLVDIRECEILARVEFCTWESQGKKVWMRR